MDDVEIVRKHAEEVGSILILRRPMYAGLGAQVRRDRSTDVLGAFVAHSRGCCDDLSGVALPNDV